MDAKRKELEAELSNLKADQTEIYEYMNKELLQKSEIIADLERKLKQADVDMKALEQRFRPLSHPLRLTPAESDSLRRDESSNSAIARLTDELTRYERELREVKDFLGKKAELEFQLDETRTTLAKERRENTLYPPPSLCLAGRDADVLEADQRP